MVTILNRILPFCPVPVFAKYRLHSTVLNLSTITRRQLKGGRETFSSIVRGIDAALAAGLPVNLRVVLDRENIAALPELAQYAADKGWTESPLFKTQLGRNYELHYCQSQQSRLYSRIDLYKDLYNLILENPVILDFHKPAYSVRSFCLRTANFPPPCLIPVRDAKPNGRSTIPVKYIPAQPPWASRVRSWVLFIRR